MGRRESGLHTGHRDRLRQRAVAEGLDGFADHQVLELLLFHAIPRPDNAVKTQAWIAIGVDALVVLTHKATKAEMSLSQRLQILSVTPFEKVPIAQPVTEQNPQILKPKSCNQLVFNI